jgi:putative SOS response-associated peptidase YedK
VIITADSQGGLLDVHDRRPVVLAADAARHWLDPATSKAYAEQLLLDLAEPAQVFEWYPVDSAVGNSRNQGPALVQRRHP